MIAEPFMVHKRHLVPIVEFIRDHPGCTTAEIKAGLGTDIPKTDIMRLSSSGVIRRIGSTDRGKARWGV